MWFTIKEIEKNEEKQELLSPKNDYVFKRVFGHQGNECITKSFISAALNQNITDVILENSTTLPKDMLDDKVGILDVKAKIDGHINCDIEMQVVSQKNIEKRILFYCSKMYVQSMKSGMDYFDAEKSIAILISNYELPSLQKIQKYVSKWNIREEEYSDIILTDAIEIIIIELTKFEKYKNDTALSSWVKFINNPKVIDVSNEEVKKAKEVLDELSQDENARYLAELREKYIMDQKAVEAAGYDKGFEKGVEQGLEKGIKKGIEQGVEQGIEKGVLASKIQFAQKLKSQGFDIEKIQELTELTIEEINNL